jgi:hypothetical protein
MTYWTDDRAAELHALIERAERCGFKSGPFRFHRGPLVADPAKTGSAIYHYDAGWEPPLWQAAAILEAELRELAEHRQPRVVMRRAGDRYAVTWVVEWPDAKDMHVGPTLAHAIVAALEARP